MITKTIKTKTKTINKLANASTNPGQVKSPGRPRLPRRESDMNYFSLAIFFTIRRSIEEARERKSVPIISCCSFDAFII